MVILNARIIRGPPKLRWLLLNALVRLVRFKDWRETDPVKRLAGSLEIIYLVEPRLAHPIKRSFGASAYLRVLAGSAKLPRPPSVGIDHSSDVHSISKPTYGLSLQTSVYGRLYKTSHL